MATWWSCVAPTVEQPRRQCTGWAKVKATLHWVGQDARPAEVVVRYALQPPDRTDGDLDADLNPGSLDVVSGALLEPSLAEMPVGEAVQFERLGYFCPDPASGSDVLVFNRTIELRDTWAKMKV